MTEPRLLRPSDVPQAMRLKQAAGWNQTEEDWLRLLELEPQGCFGIEREGRLVATATAICYGRRLAWIGMVLTDPDYRGHGLASLLMRHTLEFLDGRRIEWIKLDATDMGIGIYRKFGFVEECAVERWGRASSPAPPAGVATYPGMAGVAFDDRFGADRSRLLAHLAAGESTEIQRVGFAMGRPGSNAAYFGPCVAATPEAARSFLEWFLRRHAGEPVYWDLLPENVDAVRLAGYFGFERRRRLVRMRRGTTVPFPISSKGIYAIAGLEFG